MTSAAAALCDDATASALAATAFERAALSPPSESKGSSGRTGASWGLLKAACAGFQLVAQLASPPSREEKFANSRELLLSARISQISALR